MLHREIYVLGIKDTAMPQSSACLVIFAEK